jgi:hypothetical protein
MTTQRQTKIRRLAQKRFENICNHCGEGHLHWKLGDKWFLANNAEQPHKCSKAGA